jgi:hypothetical protein
MFVLNVAEISWTWLTVGIFCDYGDVGDFGQMNEFESCIDVAELNAAVGFQIDSLLGTIPHRISYQGRQILKINSRITKVGTAVTLYHEVHGILPQRQALGRGISCCWEIDRRSVMAERQGNIAGKQNNQDS